MEAFLKGLFWEKCYTNVEDIKFHNEFENDQQGLILSGVYIPEEILLNIFSYISPKEILNYSLVCKTWCNIIKSPVYWANIYRRFHKDKIPKSFPWYVYYCYFTTDNFTNMLKNCFGEENFNHWEILRNGGDEFIVENPPIGSGDFPKNPELADIKSCFVTSHDMCTKQQEIDLKPKRLLRYIIQEYKPDIVATEWASGRFDCASVYQMHLIVSINNNHQTYAINKTVTVNFTLDEELEWKQAIARISLDNVNGKVMKIIFRHEGKDKQFWAGHYGSKFTGAVLRFDFDSIKAKIGFKDQ